VGAACMGVLKASLSTGAEKSE